MTGAPRVLLRMEGVALFIASVVAYHALGASWRTFALLLLVPDVGLVGYAAGPRIGAYVYNALHTSAGPAFVAALAYAGVLSSAAWPVCLIWLAHIGIDRALGFGLKFTSAFHATHLGDVGRVGRREARE